jgi:hypothetical protein
VPNAGGWNWGCCPQGIAPDGGNPGAFHHCWDNVTHAPTVASAPWTESVFTGDYGTRQVISVGVDVVVMDVEWGPLDDRPLTLILTNDNGTPGYFDDDWAVFKRGPNIPPEGQGWLSHDFEIPFDAVTWPEDWCFLPWGDNAPQDPQWSDAMCRVGIVAFEFGDPELVYIMNTWEVGIDNARISWIPEPASGALVLLALVARSRRRPVHLPSAL